MNPGKYKAVVFGMWPVGTHTNTVTDKATGKSTVVTQKKCVVGFWVKEDITGGALYTTIPKVYTLSAHPKAWLVKELGSAIESELVGKLVEVDLKPKKDSKYLFIASVKDLNKRVAEANYKDADCPLNFISAMKGRAITEKTQPDAEVTF